MDWFTPTNHCTTENQNLAAIFSEEFEVENTHFESSQEISIIRSHSKFDKLFGPPETIRTNRRRTCLLRAANAAPAEIPTSIGCKNSNTSSMRKHLENFHTSDQRVIASLPKLWSRKANIFGNNGPTDSFSLKVTQASQQKSLTNYFRPNKALLSKTCGYKKERFLDDLIDLVCELNISVHALNSRKFKQYSGNLNSLCLNDFPNENKMRVLIKDRYYEILKIYDKEIINYSGQLSLLIDGWTSRNGRGFLAVCVSFLKKDGSKSSIKQRLARIIPTTSHSATDLCNILIQNIFSKQGCGPELPGVGLDPRKVMAVVCDNASTNTVIVAN
jgi:hypothetical protein